MVNSSGVKIVQVCCIRLMSHKIDLCQGGARSPDGGLEEDNVAAGSLGERGFVKATAIKVAIP